MAIQNFSPLQLNGTLSVGVNDAGHDVVFYGNTANKRVLWDTSVDHLKLYDDTKIVFGTGSAEADYDGSIYWDQTDLVIDSESDLQILSNAIVTGSVTAGAHDGSDKLYVNRFNGTYPYGHIQAGSADENVKVGIKLDTRKADGVAENALVIEGDTRAATFTGAVTVNGALNGTLATAAQTNITSLGALTALDVDDINLNGKTITITGDTDDTFSIVTGAAGATTLTTIDDNAAAGHFEIAADGNITLNSSGQIDLEIADGDYIDMYNTTNRFVSFYGESGSTSSFTMYEMGGDSNDDFFHLYVNEHGATTLTTVDAAAAAAHFEIAADGNITLDAAGSVIVETDNMSVESANANDPVLQIKNTTNDNTSGRLQFNTNRGADGQDGDSIGRILFYGQDDGTPSSMLYGEIETTIHDATNNEESGNIAFKVAAHDGGLEDGLVITGGSVDAEVDVTIANGAASVTTVAGTLTTGGTIELGHASDTTIARASAGVATIEGNQIVTAGVPKGNTFHIGCPTYVSLYLFYMNIQNYWHTPPMYNTAINGNTAIGSMSNLAVATQARAANYVAPRACKVKTVSMVFKQASSYLSGDINLEFQLIKWTPDDDGAASVAVTNMDITDHAGGFTEGDVHSLIFTVTDNAAAALAANDCLAFCARTTSAPGSGTTVRNLVNGHINYEIEIT